MKKPLSLLILLPILLQACASPQMLVLVDRPSWEALGGDARMDSGLSAIAARHGLALAVAVTGISEPVRERLTRELTRRKVTAAVIGALFSQEAVAVAEAHPGVTFILLDPGGDSLSGQRNVVRVRFDHSGALETAGYASALSLRAEGKGKAGILVSASRSGAGETEVAAFQRGFALAGAEPPVVRELPEPLDRTAVVRAAAEMAKDGVEIFFPRLGWQNLALLEALKTTGGCVVAEDWQASGVMDLLVFLSVEDDVLAGIEACLAPGTGGEVAGPVRIACGKARSMPAGLEDRIRCR